MFIRTGAQEETSAEIAEKREEKLAALEKARLIMQDVYGNTQKEEPKEQQLNHNIPNIYPIKKPLQNAAPEAFVPEVWIELDSAYLEDSLEGKYLLTRKLALMKQSVPDDVEVNIRINPKSGKAEIFARGDSLNYDQYQKAQDKIMDWKTTVSSGSPPMASDYENAKCSITPINQEAFIRNSQSALKIVNEMEKGYESYIDISKHVAKEVGVPALSSKKQADTIKNVHETLKAAGLQSVSTDSITPIYGVTQKLQQNIQR